MEQYDRVDAELYDYYSTGVEGDIAFYVEEAKKAGSPVLELGCGTGRITIPIAAAGVQIVGLDAAPAMLEVIRAKVAALQPEVRGRIRLVAGDMREFSLNERFSLIAIPYRAFCHMLTVEDQRKALHCCRDHLRDGGRLIMNQFDPRLDIISARGGPTGSALTRQSEFVHPKTGRRIIVWDSGTFHPGRQTIEQYFVFEELDDAGRVLSKTYSPFTLRWSYRYEMQHLLELCGFRIEALYGTFNRDEFRYGGEQIWVAAKA